MNCGICKHCQLVGALGQQGYGRCVVRVPAILREGMTTSAQNLCRIDRFEKAKSDAVREREAAQGLLL